MRLNGPIVRRVWTGALLVGALVATACGGDGDGETSASNELEPVKIAYTNAIDPTGFAMSVGPLEFGDEFGLRVNESDVKYLEGHALAMQLLLSGQADVIGGSFVSDLQIIDKGQDLRVFCPAWRGFASRVIGVGDVTELEQVADPDTRIAIESPGGPVNFFFDLVLQTRGVDASTRTFENIAVIEDGPLRMGALASGDVDVALISASLVPQLEGEVGAKNVHVLSDVMEDVGTGAIFATLAAKKDWLDDHVEEAGAVCASVITASREFLDDYGLFKRLVDEYIEADLGDADLRPVWEETKEDTLWPLEPALDEDGVNLVIETAKETELLPEDSELTYDSVVDERPMERARELLE